MPNHPNLFDRLPDETILDIIRHLHCDDGPGLNPHIWHFSQCDSRIRRVAVGPLYQSLRVIRPNHLDVLLLTIIDAPEYSQLVKTLNVQLKSDRPSYMAKSLGEEAKTKLSTSGKNTPEIYINVARNRRLSEDFISQLASQHSWAKALLLFHLLPQLEELAMIHEEFGDSPFDFHLSALVHNHHLFPKLISFTRVSLDPSKPYGCFLGPALVPIFFCPSVKTVSAHRADAHYAVIDDDILTPSNTHIATWRGTSNVETLNLPSGYIDGRHVAQLLLLPRALKRFTCRQGIDQVYYTGIHDLFSMAMEHISATLEFLDIAWASERSGSWLTIGSLQCFRSLKKLLINYSFLFRRDSQGGLPLISTLLPPNLEVLGMRAEAVSRLRRRDKLEGIRRLLIDKSPSCVPSLRVVGDIGNPRFLHPLLELAFQRSVKIELNPKLFEYL
ncbi:hypothetical protein CPB86DRAFT_248470 [Serendipita vermifera]|nr:hypothetical protein CPB86DRAFT_248470 [Serendipita vermifera]